jgi:hypothetical protein
MKFSTLFPHLRPWVNHLAHVWPAYYVKPTFAGWEILHILALVILGGAAILIGLRLIGVGVTEEAPSEVYTNLRLWVHTGVIGVIVTGVLIGMANAERLYDSAAFTAKMLCLLAGVLVTYGAMRPIALADGRVGTAALAWGIAALAVWALAIFVFLTGGLITPGLYHMLTAAALIVLFVTPGRARWVYLAGLLAILLSMYVTTHVIIPTDDLKRADPANVALAWIAAAWIFGMAGWRLFNSRGEVMGDAIFAKAVGYATILIWVTGAAAGRWIAFA